MKQMKLLLIIAIVLLPALCQAEAKPLRLPDPRPYRGHDPGDPTPAQAELPKEVPSKELVLELIPGSEEVGCLLLRQRPALHFCLPGQQSAADLPDRRHRLQPQVSQAADTDEVLLPGRISCHHHGIADPLQLHHQCLPQPYSRRPDRGRGRSLLGHGKRLAQGQGRHTGLRLLCRRLQPREQPRPLSWQRRTKRKKASTSRKS